MADILYNRGNRYVEIHDDTGAVYLHIVITQQQAKEGAERFRKMEREGIIRL